MLKITKQFNRSLITVAFLLLAGMLTTEFLTGAGKSALAVTTNKTSPVKIGHSLDDGCAWRESELGWHGSWNRQTIEKEGTQIFNAEWGKEGQKPVEATLEVTISGNTVSILRRNKGKNKGTCNYTGTLSQDRKSVSGTYSCSDKTQKFDWSAEIHERCF